MDKKHPLTKETIRYFWRHAWQYKKYVIGLLATVPLANLTLQYLPSLIVSHILQRISNGHFTHGALWSSFGSSLMAYAIISFLGGVILWRVAIFFIWKLEMQVIRTMYREIFAHLLSLSANFHANRFGGSLVSQTNKLVSAYVRVADTTVFDLFTLFLSFVFSSIILFPRVPWIATFLLIFSALFMFMATKVTKKVRRLRSEESASETKQTGVLADVITNVLAVKSFAGGDHERGLFRQATDRTEHATMRVMFTSLKTDTVFATSTIFMSITSLTFALASMVLFKASIGTAFLVVTYTGIISQRLWDFAQSMLRNYNRAFGDAEEMIQILAIKPDVKDPISPEKVRIEKGAIDLQHMSFTHPDSRDGEVLFDNLDLHIKAGEKIGLVGHSGSGKTTLTKLLLRFNDIDAGEILIDGQNIAHITQDDLRRHIAYVPQEPLLFHRSITENIAYGRPGATEAEIAEAAHKAYAHEFVERLPKGYDTLVGERGVKLSGGQRQRIVIARAILKDAPILVLDEATSALDSESEKLIQAALWELMKGRTAIVIAHRLSTIQKMDRILVLDNGKILEQGSHQELLAEDGTYAKLWAHQSGGFIDD